MTYNGAGDAAAPAAADQSSVFNAAVERAKAIAARLSQVKPPGDQYESASNSTTSGTKRSHAEFDDYRPPSSGYRREDFQSSERDSKRQAPDHDQYGGGSRSFGSNPYDRQNDNYGGSSGGGGGRARFGLGHSDAPASSHYGPGASGGRSTVSEEITVPNQFVGLIIGRSGDNLKRIESTCNVKVQVASDKTDGPDADRRTTITGEPEDVARAKAMIMEQVNQGNAPPFRAPVSAAPPANPSDSITVPAHKVGLVIGRGGETIHRLQDQSGASINVVQESAQDTSSGLRTITLSGNPAAVDMAKQLIDELVNSQGPPGRFQNNFRGDTEVVKVHTDRVGLVIGRGGETVKGIQMQCDVKIKIDSQSDPEGNRTVTISGPPENIARAKEMVMERAYSRRENGPPGHGGGGGGYQQQQQYPQQHHQQYNQFGPPGNYGAYGQDAWAGGGGAEGAPGAYAGYDASAYGWNAAAYGAQQGGETGGAPGASESGTAGEAAAGGAEGQQQQQQQPYDQEAWAAYYAQYQQYYGQYPQYAVPATGDPSTAAAAAVPDAPAPDASTEKDSAPAADQPPAPSATSAPPAAPAPSSPPSTRDDDSAAAPSADASPDDSTQPSAATE